MLSNTPRLEFCCLKIIHIVLAKIIAHILENKQKNKCVSIHEVTQLIKMKMKIKMKNRSHRYDANDLDLDINTNIVNIKRVQYDDAYMY